jgi:hypothetical protein
MIVGYLHVLGTVGGPFEANAPLPVDANAVLTLPISSQSLKPVARQGGQIA